LAAGLRPNPLGDYSGPPDPLTGFRGEGRDGREGRDRPAQFFVASAAYG